MTYTNEQAEEILATAGYNIHRFKSHELADVLNASFEPNFVLTDIDSGSAGEDDIVMADLREAIDSMASYLDISTEELEGYDSWVFKDITEEFIACRDAAISDLELENA